MNKTKKYITALTAALTALTLFLAAVFASPPTQAQAAEEPWLTAEERIYGLSLIWRYSIDMFAKWDTMPEGFDWNALYIEYLTKVINASDIIEYYFILNSFVAHLDSKSNVSFPPGLNRYISPIAVRHIEGRFIVTAADPDITNIPLGSEIVSVNGMPPLDYFEENYGRLLGLQTPLVRELWASDFLSLSFFDVSLDVEALTLDGVSLTETLIFMQQSMFTGRGLALGDVSYPYVSNRMGARNLFSVQVHENNIHRIIIPSFWDSRVFDAVRSYLHNARSTAAGFILDIRGNSGGLSSPCILSHFIDAHELNMVLPYTQLRNAFYMGQASWVNMGHWEHFSDATRAGARMLEGVYLVPSESNWPVDLDSLNRRSLNIYDVPLVILADYRAGSAADNFAAFAEGIDRFTTIGTNTMGASGYVAVFPLPGGGTFRLAVQRYFTHDGREINNTGINPDIWVEQTIEDLLNGIDTQLAAAVAYLRERIAQ